KEHTVHHIRACQSQIDRMVFQFAFDTPRTFGVFLWTGKSLLDAADITPGEVIEVRLRKADADAVDVPDDVALALLQNEAQSRWDDLTPGKQRGLLHPVSTAKKPETRVRRIAKLIEALSA
ncbi:MAG: YdeI/OmpD-associated family protein, partial [Pseudomonadota bacterium]